MFVSSPSLSKSRSFRLLLFIGWVTGCECRADADMKLPVGDTAPISDLGLTDPARDWALLVGFAIGRIAFFLGGNPVGGCLGRFAMSGAIFEDQTYRSLCGNIQFGGSESVTMQRPDFKFSVDLMFESKQTVVSETRDSAARVGVSEKPLGSVIHHLLRRL